MDEVTAPEAREIAWQALVRAERTLVQAAGTPEVRVAQAQAVVGVGFALLAVAQALAALKPPPWAGGPR